MIGIEVRYDRPKGNFGPVKNKRINDAVEDFFERVRASGPVAWAASDVPVATGQLFESFQVGRIRKSRGPGGTFYSLNMGVGKIKTTKPKWAGSPGEQYYPKFVQMGTKDKEPILGKNMPVRDRMRNIKTKQKRKNGKFVKGKQKMFVSSVRGQFANPYMDRFNRKMGNFTRGNKAALTREIKRIINE